MDLEQSARIQKIHHNISDITANTKGVFIIDILLLFVKMP